jgi:GNAT superfamily N-acetyltransferase
VIRRARPAEAPAIAELWLRARRAAAKKGAIPPPAHSPEAVRAHFASEVLPAHEVWVACGADGSLLAMMSLDGDRVGHLYVEPAHTGRGVGTELIELAKRERPGGLSLWAFQSNRGARRFYERHGFAAVRLTDGAANEERAPDVLYAWGRGAGSDPVAS